jgi:hypothetical protein
MNELLFTVTSITFFVLLSYSVQQLIPTYIPVEVEENE